MDEPFLWILAGPFAVLLILYYAAFIGAGLGLLIAAYKSPATGRRMFFLAAGLSVMAAPFAASVIRQIGAEHKAAERQQQLARMERADLTGRLPRNFLTVGNYAESDIAFIKSQYPMTPFAPDEQERLASVYAHYRAREFCLTHSAGKMMAPNVKIPICKDIPDTIQEALGLKEPVLIFAEGFSTSYRRSNTLAGDIYEIRLITPSKDLLVDYFEQTTLDDPASFINPYASGQKLKSGEPTLTRRAFIERALEGASQ